MDLRFDLCVEHTAGTHPDAAFFRQLVEQFEQARDRQIRNA